MNIFICHSWGNAVTKALLKLLPIKFMCQVRT